MNVVFLVICFVFIAFLIRLIIDKIFTFDSNLFDVAILIFSITFPFLFMKKRLFMKERNKKKEK